MFADRIRQGHKLFFAHGTYTVEHTFFNCVQFADDGTLVDSAHISLGKEEKRRAGGGDRCPPTPFSQPARYSEAGF